MNGADDTYSDYTPAASPADADNHPLGPLFERGDKTLTAGDIVNSYVSVYRAVHGETPNCTHIGATWYLVNDDMRDRRWLILEVERLRQEALQAAVDAHQNKSQGPLLKIIRRLARL